MPIYNETNLELDALLTPETDVVVPVNFDLTRMVGHLYDNNQIFTSFLGAMEEIISKWLFQLKELGEGQNPNLSGDIFLSHLASTIGFPLFNETGTTLADQRMQLVNAVASYKTKGTYGEIQSALNGAGILTAIQDTYVLADPSEDGTVPPPFGYTPATARPKTAFNYDNFSQHEFLSFFNGQSPASLGYFKTPHFYLVVMLNILYNPGLTESLWNQLQDDRLNSILENNRPINSYPIVNLLLSFTKTFSGGELAISNPDIFSSYIDARPVEDFRLNAETYNSSTVTDNEGVALFDNENTNIQTDSAPWNLNDGVPLNYSLNPVQLQPTHFLLGQEGEKNVTLYMSFSHGTNWATYVPEINTYYSKLLDGGDNAAIISGGNLIINSRFAAYQEASTVDLVNKNNIISYNQYIPAYTGSSLYSSGVMLCRNLYPNEFLLSNTNALQCVIESITSGGNTSDYFRIYRTFADGSASIKQGEYQFPIPLIKDVFHSIRLCTHGIGVDVTVDGILVLSNINVSIVNESQYMLGTYMSFTFTCDDVASPFPMFNTLQVINIGNQDQNFSFDDPVTIIRDSFSGMTNVDGHVPEVSLYGSVWHDPSGATLTYNALAGGAAIIGYSDPTAVFPSVAYIDLVETNVKISCYVNWGSISSKFGFTILQGINTLLGGSQAESVRVVFDSGVGNISIIQYIGNTVESVIASNSGTISTGNFPISNKLEVYIVDGVIQASFNSQPILTASVPYLAGNYKTRFGFFSNSTGTNSQLDGFSNLLVQRAGFGMLNTSSSSALLYDNFTGNTLGTPLANITPDVDTIVGTATTGWQDPNNAWKIGTFGVGVALVENTTNPTYIAASYIDLGIKNVDITVIMQQVNGSSDSNRSWGIVFLNNTSNGKAIRFRASYGYFSTDITYHLETTYFGVVTNTLFTLENTSFGTLPTVLRVLVNKVYDILTVGTKIYQHYYNISLFVSDGISNSDVYLGTFQTPDDAYGTKLSLWWDGGAGSTPKILSVRVDPILTTNEILSGSEAYFGDITCTNPAIDPSTGNPIPNTFGVDMIVPVNEVMPATTEVAILAGDAETLLGGITYPPVDKNLNEQMEISGTIYFG